MSLYPPEASAPPPQYKLADSGLSKGQKVDKLLEKYEINPYFSEKLSILDDFEIVCILDDSGSMKTPLNDHTGHATRWDELKDVINTVMDVALVFDDDGIDAFFLNRTTLLNVTDHDTLNATMDDPPYGRTPLTRVTNSVFQRYANHDKKVLLIIATDGVPTTDHGYTDLDAFESCIRNRNSNQFYISFLACSDNNNEIGYLDRLDRQVPNVDTLDDYHSEKQQIQKIQGNDFHYNLQDHIVRLLLGPIYPEFDQLDEIPISQMKNRTSNVGTPATGSSQSTGPYGTPQRHDGNAGCSCMIM